LADASDRRWEPWYPATLPLGGGVGTAFAAFSWGESPILDRRHRRLLFWQGTHSRGYDDARLWQLDLTDPAGPSFSVLAPGGAPDKRLQSAFLVDPASERLLVVGGLGPDSATLAIDLRQGCERWDLLPTSGDDPFVGQTGIGRAGATLVYDTPNARAILFGGY